jgi:hypothetical protein
VATISLPFCLSVLSYLTCPLSVPQSPALDVLPVCPISFLALSCPVFQGIGSENVLMPFVVIFFCCLLL